MLTGPVSQPRGTLPPMRRAAILLAAAAAMLATPGADFTGSAYC